MLPIFDRDQGTKNSSQSSDISRKASSTNVTGNDKGGSGGQSGAHPPLQMVVTYQLQMVLTDRNRTQGSPATWFSREAGNPDLKVRLAIFTTVATDSFF